MPCRRRLVPCRAIRDRLPCGILLERTGPLPTVGRGSGPVGSDDEESHAPPPGKTHRYRFHLYALDAPLDAKLQLDNAALLRAMKGHIVGEGLFTGTYRR